MRHRKKTKKFGANASHREAILRNLAAEIFKHERIKTTQLRAKQVCPLVDKIVTLAKRGDFQARRQVLAIVQDKELVHKIFSEIAPRFKERQGGYTRILKLGPRQGDAAPMVLVELV